MSRHDDRTAAPRPHCAQRRRNVDRLESPRVRGRSVVLVHGITESAASFDPITERLGDAHEVITLDLRGHGESGTAASYDLASMAGDVVAVVAAAGLTDGVAAPGVHLVGHSLGGAVVSAVGAVLPVASVVDIDQSLQLGAFKAAAGRRRGAAPRPRPVPVRDRGDVRGDERRPAARRRERARIADLRRPDHDVILGVWDLLLTSPEAEIAASVDAALAGYRDHPTPYLALFGIDPGDGVRRHGWPIGCRARRRGVGRSRSLSAPRRPGPVRRPSPRVLGWLRPTSRRTIPSRRAWRASLADGPRRVRVRRRCSSRSPTATS